MGPASQLSGKSRAAITDIVILMQRIANKASDVIGCKNFKQFSTKLLSTYIHM